MRPNVRGKLAPTAGRQAQATRKYTVLWLGLGGLPLVLSLTEGLGVAVSPQLKTLICFRATSWLNVRRRKRLALQLVLNMNLAGWHSKDIPRAILSKYRVVYAWT